MLYTLGHSLREAETRKAKDCLLSVAHPSGWSCFMPPHGWFCVEPIILLASTPKANGIRSSPLGTFKVHNPAPSAIRRRLTTTWPASLSRNSAIRCTIT